MFRHLFLVMIEAQNKSCNLGYTTVSAVFVHLNCINFHPRAQGRGLNSTCLVRLLKISWILKKMKSYLPCFLIKMARAYTDKILKTLCIHE